MARPQKNNLDYFSHDKDMRNDIKIRNLRRKFGHKGYSIYVMMLEHLSNCDYLQYEWNDLSIELLVPDFDIDIEELVEIINHCVKLNLFQIELGIIYSSKFYERNNKVLTDRSGFDLNNSRLSQLKQDLLSKSEINPSLPNESTQSKVKESKVKESKTKNSIIEESKVENNKVKESKVDDKLKRLVTACKPLIEDGLESEESLNKMTMSYINPILERFFAGYKNWKQDINKRDTQTFISQLPDNVKEKINDHYYAYIQAYRIL